MRFAIYSDVHSNLEALETVLADISRKKVDANICLGDIVGYGPDPNECVDRVLRDVQICIAGNHDHAALKRISLHNFNAYAKAAIEWTQGVLSKDSQERLGALGLTAEKEEALLVHATPRDPEKWSYILTMEHAAACFQDFTQRFCFVGHTHSPSIVTEEDGTQIRLQDTDEYQLTKNQRCLVNVGSVGQPRDRDSRTCYAIYDSAKRSVSLHRLPYDIQATQKKMKAQKQPEFNIRRLVDGR